MKLKVKKLHPDAIIPKYATAGAAAFDLCAVNSGRVMPGLNAIVETGLAFEIPEGYVMLVFSRSGHGFNNNVRLSNCVGVIDSDYRGEVKAKLTCDGRCVGIEFKKGDRIAQAVIVPIPQVELEEVDDLSSTERGEGGFGSTGAAS